MIKLIYKELVNIVSVINRYKKISKYRITSADIIVHRSVLYIVRDGYSNSHPLNKTMIMIISITLYLLVIFYVYQ